MTTRLNPYLTFDGNAREAMEFYASVLGGAPALTPFSAYGDPGAPEADLVMHGVLETDAGFTLMGADNPPGSERRTGNDITLSLSGDDTDLLRDWFARLSEGGLVQVPLEQQMWGDEFGMCSDRFGVGWMVNIAGSQA